MKLLSVCLHRLIVIGEVLALGIGLRWGQTLKRESERERERKGKRERERDGEEGKEGEGLRVRKEMQTQRAIIQHRKCIIDCKTHTSLKFNAFSNTVCVYNYVTKNQQDSSKSSKQRVFIYNI